MTAALSAAEAMKLYNHHDRQNFVCRKQLVLSEERKLQRGGVFVACEGGGSGNRKYHTGGGGGTKAFLPLLQSWEKAAINWINPWINLRKFNEKNGIGFCSACTTLLSSNSRRGVAAILEVQMVKKVPILYRTGWFSTIFARARSVFLFWVWQSHSTFSHLSFLR